MQHYHGSDTPTSPRAILLHSSLMGAIELQITRYLMSVHDLEAQKIVLLKLFLLLRE